MKNFSEGVWVVVAMMLSAFLGVWTVVGIAVCIWFGRHP
jgi:hypothetical protein